jgi:PIN domain nuclease of toxin-antitoxin system
MRLLVDTQVFIWCRENNRRLEPRSRRQIERAEVVKVSVVSAWEMMIKSSIGKLRVPPNIQEAIADAGFEELLLTFRHVEALATLPLHHGDPFDRMLIAQAIAEDMTLLTSDERFAEYNARVQLIK